VAQLRLFIFFNHFKIITFGLASLLKYTLLKITIILTGLL